MPVMIRYNSATELCITKGQEGYVHGWKAKTGKHGKLVLDVLFIKLHKPPNPPAPIKFDGLPENVVPITRNTVRIECKLSDDSEIAISRTQVEILPNFAMTDFASQGKTRDWNVVDIHNSRDFRAIYTALSRSSCADQTLILQGFNTNLLTGGIKNKGGYRQELRELELLDEITRLKYLGILSPSVFGDRRSSLIKSFRTVQGINFVPASVHKSIEWNDSDPLPDTFDSGETWQIISADNETDQKNKRQLKGNFKTAKGATQNETKGRTLKRKAQAEESERPSTTPKKKIKEDVPAQIQRNSASYLSYPSLRWFLNSCAYDSAIILLYYLYVNHFEIEMSHFTQILSMDLLDAFRSGITDLTAARENVRRGLHNIDSEAFFYGQYADAGEVLLALTQSDLSFSRSQVICTNNHVHKPWKNRTNMLLYMSTRMYQSTQQWVDNFVQPFGWQCQICHTELQTVIEFTRFPKFFLLYVPINASMEIDRMINLTVNGNQKPYDLKAIIYFGEEHFILRIFSNQAEYIYDGIKKWTTFGSDDLVEGNTTIVSTNITESPSKTDLLGRDENQTHKEARINELREQYSKDLGRVKFWKDPSMIDIPVGKPRPFLIRRYGNPPSPVSQCKKRIDQLADTLYDSNLRCEALSLNLQAASYALESAERERDRAVEEHTKLRKEVVGLHCELRRLQDRIKTGGWDLIRLSDSVDIV
ncbi:hypothetical protein D9758_005259 [Tetrapyrgos nigripes]|uniref:Uncharacterized protein n=1 Tax=Tetrapyrgos nigripes TaxID=182062 RepID=A0A8H5GWY5_9AGAR|nr:hypothetical protein D9758_005259 [Tetrapyrgos nigripes]